MRPWPVFAILLGSACTQPLPGEVVGTYRVIMNLEENTCGESAVYLQDGREYSVEIRSDDPKGYWRLADSSPVQGWYEDDTFEFTFSSLVAASGRPDAGPMACRLQQDELLNVTLVTLATPAAGAEAQADGGADGGTETQQDGGAEGIQGDAGPAETRLMGEHVLTISAYAGTDCTEALQSEGGGFVQLPCSVRYSLSGTERDPF